MNALDHALAGSLMADLLPFTPRLGRKAQIAAIVAGMAPDLDFMPAFIANFPPKTLTFHGLLDQRLTVYHRTYSHSFFFALLGAVVLALPIRRFCGGKGGWWQWALLLWLPLASHIILDIANPWDVACWLPFSSRREALSLMPLLDPVFTSLLGLGFVLNHVLRDPYHDPGDPIPLHPVWREKTARFINGRMSVPAAAWIITGLLVVRIALTVVGVFPYPVLYS